MERERERERFKEAEWRDVKAEFSAMSARLSSLGGKQVAQGKDFDSSGKAQDPDLKILSKRGNKGPVCINRQPKLLIRWIYYTTF